MAALHTFRTLLLAELKSAIRTDVDDDYRFVYMGPKGSWTPLHSGLVIFFSRKIALTQQSVLTRMSRRLWILQLECQRVWEKEVDLLPP